MTKTFDIKVGGLLQVEKRIKGVGVFIAGASAEAVRNTAIDVNRLAKQFCPVDTGRLRSSIQLVDFNPKEPSAVVGTDVEYAEFVEYGTSRQSAQPYMRPAAEEGKHILKAEMEKELKGI